MTFLILKSGKYQTNWWGEQWSLENREDILAISYPGYPEKGVYTDAEYVEVEQKCQAAIYVEGSAGTRPSVADPCNFLGGATYAICGKPAHVESVFGTTPVYLCFEHFKFKRGLK